MTAPRHVAVIDIGKTNAKLALVDIAARSELAALRQPNRVKTDGLYPHYDIEAIWSFILDGLASLRRDHPIDAISVTTHGATAALVDKAGELALPVLDYEFDGPDRGRLEYDAVRPPFAETGSPALPIGLNLGAQLFWLHQEFPEAFDRAASILTYPQFWSRRLTGIAATEVTSLGCHTDLWNPHKNYFSTLVDQMGWRNLFPPMRRADTVLGPVLPEIVERTGVDPATPVVCGIHDSNASLLPHLVDRKPPFAVVSTGTWVVVMAIGGDAAELDPVRDTLINVNAFGDPVPSARFMGGREFELLMARHSHQSDGSDVAAVLESGTMLLPSMVAGSGPFSDHHARWLGLEPQGGQRHAVGSFYLALMTATCLDLAGAAGTVVVEGPFAANRPYLSMLSAATGRPVTCPKGQGTGTSIGAALLADGKAVTTKTEITKPSHDSVAMSEYARNWNWRVAGRGT
ncbi:MAG: FGGY-family carbohydrate kinase [Rhizobiaceae bacterium]|nr:FGGY-family carbohydrate kinase [Rhizobiaceae bacterium]MCV0405947.1 FGGY-family carbohydrate kinase [Rhizobiaceae bacterium]